MDFDPRARDDDAHDVETPWAEPDRELQVDLDPHDIRGRDDDTRDRERDVDPRDVFVAGLELPRGPEREVVLDGDHRRENDGADSYYYRARYFNPSIDRFIGEDPLGVGGGDTNLFTYVRNAPTANTDPSGMVAVRVPPGMFPSCDKLQGRRKATAWERFWCNIELSSALPIPAGVFTAGESAGLRALFGREAAGAEALLNRIMAGERIALPEGVTAEVLQRYLKLAEEAIEAGKDLVGTQAARKAAIEALLQQLGIR
jgi:RHS repeat-associated protein